MKIIRVSNYDDEMVNDVLIETGLSEKEASDKANKLNAERRNDVYWFKAVPDAYNLYEFKP